MQYKSVYVAVFLFIAIATALSFGFIVDNDDEINVSTICYGDTEIELRGDFVSEDIFSISYDGNLTISCHVPALSYKWVCINRDVPASTSLIFFDRYVGDEFLEKDGSITIEGCKNGSFDIEVSASDIDRTEVFVGSIYVLGQVEQDFFWTYFGVEYSTSLIYDYSEYVIQRDDAINRSPRFEDYTYFASRDNIVIDALATGITTKYNNLSDVQLAQVMLAFVQQCIDYPQYTFGGTSPMSADLYLKGHDNYVLFPIETLYCRLGDCEDTAILYSSIMRSLGYKSGLLIVPNHVMSCINLDPSNLSVYDFFFCNGGRTYFVCETTNNQYAIGQVPANLHFKGTSLEEWCYSDHLNGFGFYET